jgi:hypothetical protein
MQNCHGGHRDALCQKQNRIFVAVWILALWLVTWICVSGVLQNYLELVYTLIYSECYLCILTHHAQKIERIRTLSTKCYAVAPAHTMLEIQKSLGTFWSIQKEEHASPCEQASSPTRRRQKKKKHKWNKIARTTATTTTADEIHALFD